LKRAEKVQELAKICVQWNVRELTPNEAMYKIYKMFHREITPHWRKYCQEKEANG